MAKKSHDVCAVDDIDPGGMLAVEVAGVPVLVFRGSEGEFYALRNACSHMGARLSDGRLQNKMDSPPDEQDYVVSATEDVIRCPWHGYEFDIRSGRCAGDPERISVKAFRAFSHDGRVLVER